MSTKTTEQNNNQEGMEKQPVIITYPDGTIVKAESVVFVANNVSESKKGDHPGIMVGALGGFNVEMLLEMQQAVNKTMSKMGSELLDNMREKRGDEGMAEYMADLLAGKLAEKLLGSLSDEEKDEARREQMRSGEDDGCTCDDCNRIRAEIEEENKGK